MNNKLILGLLSFFLITIACNSNQYANSNVKQAMIDSLDNDNKIKKMNITIGNKVLTATLTNNSSVEALKAELAKAPIIIEMRDYGNMKKVGPLGRNLPTNDESITTQAGDIILYQGNMLVIYYAPNSWDFTKLGKIDNLNAKELKEVLGNGGVTVKLSLQ